MLKAIDKSYEVFGVGNVLVTDSYGTLYGVKILKSVYVEEVSEYRFIVQDGKVRDGKFVADGSGKYVNLFSLKQLREYAHKWTPGVDATPGDVLKDEKTGDLFLFVGQYDVWNLKEGTRTSLEGWKDLGKTFKVHTTRGGEKFHKKISVSVKASTI